MALPVLQDAKDLLRIETTAEDDLLTAMLTRAQAMVEAWIQRPITAAARTDVIRLECATTLFHLHTWPVDTASLVLTDEDGDTVASNTYTVTMAGTVEAVSGESFSAGRYTATYDAGWSAHPQYETRYEPILSQAILDTVADWYQRRSPGAMAEDSGGGVSRQWTSQAIPARIRSALAPMQPREVR